MYNTDQLKEKIKAINDEFMTIKYEYYENINEYADYLKDLASKRAELERSLYLQENVNRLG